MQRYEMKEGRKGASFGLRKVGWMLYGLLKLFLIPAEQPGGSLQIVQKVGSVDRVLLCVCVQTCTLLSLPGELLSCVTNIMGS